jgi:hypothetical protein
MLVWRKSTPRLNTVSGSRNSSETLFVRPESSEMSESLSSDHEIQPRRQIRDNDSTVHEHFNRADQKLLDRSELVVP